MLVEDLAVDDLELHSRNSRFSSLQVVSEPSHPQVEEVNPQSSRKSSSKGFFPALQFAWP